jgi:hypothetical protein
MHKEIKNKLFIIPSLIIILLSVFLACCTNAGSSSTIKAASSTVLETTATIKETPTSEKIETTLPQNQQQVEYRNTEYGFSFSLPISWKGYSIETSSWDGNSPDQQGDVVVEKGPIISIRHPEWTSANPRQDIPIMIFTLSQWDSLQQEKFFIGAAPVGPSELGRNTIYVFALPARYNYSFLLGFEEVEKILESKPLKTFPPI